MAKEKRVWVYTEIATPLKDEKLQAAYEVVQDAQDTLKEAQAAFAKMAEPMLAKLVPKGHDSKFAWRYGLAFAVSPKKAGKAGDIIL